MPLISDKDRDLLRAHFQEHLKSDVEVVYFTQGESGLSVPGYECGYCRETHELLEELSGLSERIRLQVHDFVAEAKKAQELAVDMIPAMVIKGQVRGQIRYFGVPSGYEFPVLVEGLIDASTGTTSLPAPVKQSLSHVQNDVHIKVFVTPT
jgi:alkyl hydroperoxide reductase subunit AhpF